MWFNTRMTSNPKSDLWMPLTPILTKCYLQFESGQLYRRAQFSYFSLTKQEKKFSKIQERKEKKENNKEPKVAKQSTDHPSTTVV